MRLLLLEEFGLKRKGFLRPFLKSARLDFKTKELRRSGVELRQGILLLAIQAAFLVKNKLESGSRKTKDVTR